MAVTKQADVKTVAWQLTPFQMFVTHAFYTEHVVSTEVEAGHIEGNGEFIYYSFLCEII